MDFAPIISKNIRCRVPDAFSVGEGSVIDDFCYFSTKVAVGRFCHVANNVSIAGGGDLQFTMGDYSAVSAGARIWCASDDFNCDLAALGPPGLSFTKKGLRGDVSLGECVIVGSNSVILPDNTLPEGVAIGALSLVPAAYEFEPWALYAGVPIRKIRMRDREEIERQRDGLEAGLASLRESAG